ncbi:Transcript cleavage factor greA [Candidatus Karelsulcia muelleri]|nr:Transcript cleavage factor greA [Candidatus Karelsulcia muelleri]
MVEYNSKKGIKKLLKKLKDLENLERLKIAEEIAEAIEKGDLSENSEYKIAKENQRLLEIKIFNLKKKINNTRIIYFSKINTTKVSIFTKVKVKNIETGECIYYTLVPETESNIKKLKISIDTPIAKGLIGKKRGEIAHIKLPNQKFVHLKILKIKLYKDK